MRIPAAVALALKGDRPMGRLLRPVANRLLPSHPIPVTVLSGPARGLWLVIDTHYEKSFWTGAHERELLTTLGRVLHPGSVFWDIGAHIGMHSLFASRCVGPGGHVHAFEPAAANIIRLRRAVRLNASMNVTAHEMALSNRSGSAILYRADAPSTRTLIPGLQDSEGDEVRCETADRVAEQLGSPDVIKVDAEGSEMMVLEGAGQVLSRSRPVLIVEYWTTDAVAQAKAAFPQYGFRQIDQSNWLMMPNRT